MAFFQGALLGLVLVATSIRVAQSRSSGSAVETSVTANTPKSADVSVTSMRANASKRVSISARDSRDPAECKFAMELIQTGASRLSRRRPSASLSHTPSTPVTHSPHIPAALHVVGGILLLSFLAVLQFASTDILVGMAAFLDQFMTTGLLPFAPTVTPNYQLIGVLQSSKNLVACLLVPFTGKLIDGNEAKSVQFGMVCATLCSLGFAMEKNYAFWLAMRTLSGCSTAGILWGGFAFLNRLYANDATARTKAVSRAMAGLYAGVVAGPQIGGIFVDNARLMFLVLSGVQMCFFWTLRFRLPDLSQLQEPPPKQTEAVTKVGMLELLLDPEIRQPIVALFLGLALEGAVTATTFEYMTSLGYDSVKQNLTWLMGSIPGVISANLVPTLRPVVGGHALQISALMLGGGSALACFGAAYTFLAITLLGISCMSGLLHGNAAAMLADRSQEKYHGTGQVFILSNTADQIAFVIGPYTGSFICRYTSFHSMCQSIGGGLVLYAVLLSCPGEGWSSAKQQTTTGTEAPPEAS